MRAARWLASLAPHRCRDFQRSLAEDALTTLVALLERADAEVNVARRSDDIARRLVVLAIGVEELHNAPTDVADLDGGSPHLAQEEVREHVTIPPYLVETRCELPKTIVIRLVCNLRIDEDVDQAFYTERHLL